MPSPVAHGFIGLGIGLARFIPRVPGWRELFREIWRRRWELFLCILLANIPDIDYLFGIPAGDLNLYHHTVTHTFVWSVFIVVAVWACGWPNRSWRGLLFIFILVFSHLVLDIFTADYSKPYGIMLLWPVWTDYWHSPFSLFPASAKSSFRDLCTLHNVKVCLAEAAVTLPFVFAVFFFKLRKKEMRNKSLRGYHQ